MIHPLKHSAVLKDFYFGVLRLARGPSPFPELPVTLHPSKSRGTVLFRLFQDLGNYDYWILPVLNTRDKTYEIRVQCPNFNIEPEGLRLFYRLRFRESVSQFDGRLCRPREFCETWGQVSLFFASKNRFNYRVSPHKRLQGGPNVRFLYDKTTGVIIMRFLPNGFAIRPPTTGTGGGRRRHGLMYLLEVELFVSIRNGSPVPLTRFGLPFRVFTGTGEKRGNSARLEKAKWIGLAADGRCRWGETNVNRLSGIPEPENSVPIVGIPWGERMTTTTTTPPNDDYDDDVDVDMGEADDRFDSVIGGVSLSPLPHLFAPPATPSLSSDSDFYPPPPHPHPLLSLGRPQDSDLSAPSRFGLSRSLPQHRAPRSRSLPRFYPQRRLPQRAALPMPLFAPSPSNFPPPPSFDDAPLPLFPSDIPPFFSSEEEDELAEFE